MFKNNSGFTLVEMLIVLSIISVLILLIAPNLGKSSETVRNSGCEALKSVVQAQVQLYYLENGEYPEDLEDDLVKDYLDESQLSCPNGKEFDYNEDTGEVTIVEKDGS